MSEYGKGCLKGKIDIRDYRIKRNVAMAVAFPDTYECPNRVAVKHQGRVGSCVAHATAEILESHSAPGTKLSTNFLYGIHNELYGSLGPGMYMREAANIVLKYGDPSYELCPGNTEVSEVYKIASDAFNKPGVLESAAKHRIDSYARLKTINDIKYALINYGPVLASIEWYSKNKVTKGVLIQDGEKDGGHAIMLYGWNEQGWLMQNSWGRYWGVNGCCVLPYDYKISEAFSFVPASSLDDDIVIPAGNKLWEVIFKIINSIINLFIKHD